MIVCITYYVDPSTYVVYLWVFLYIPCMYMWMSLQTDCVSIWLPIWDVGCITPFIVPSISLLAKCKISHHTPPQSHKLRTHNVNVFVSKCLRCYSLQARIFWRTKTRIRTLTAVVWTRRMSEVSCMGFEWCDMESVISLHRTLSRYSLSLSLILSLSAIGGSKFLCSWQTSHSSSLM